MAQHRDWNCKVYDFSASCDPEISEPHRITINTITDTFYATVGHSTVNINVNGDFVENNRNWRWIDHGFMGILYWRDRRLAELLYQKWSDL